MRPLKQGLHDHELIVLRVIGEWWELDLIGTDKNGCVKKVADALLTLDLVQEKEEFLPPEEASALDDLIANHGKVPVKTFARTHGEIRMMGPGRLEREEPWFDPVSAAEALWYRGFLYIGFEEASDGLMEFVYFPDELLAQFPQLETTEPKVSAMPEQSPELPELNEEEEVKVETLTATTPSSRQAVSPLMPQDSQNQTAVSHAGTASSNAVDDLTTLLAMAQQTGLQPDKLDKLDWLLLNPEPERRSLLINLAHEMGMLRKSKAGVRPTRTAVSWLKQSREQQLRALADAWSSSGWNELRHMSALHCEGENWENDPILARSTLLDNLPRTTNWYNFADLAAQIKQESPDFQRPDGNYDVWYIRDAATNEYINGFDNWDQVEGRLLAFLLEGPMAWLGLAITAVPANGLQFQLSDRGLEWLEGVEAAPKEVRVPLVVQQDGTLIAPHNADRYQRFQAARISEAEPVVRVESGKQHAPYQYRLTPASLAQAGKQGITPDRILDFLEAATGQPVPIGVKRGISRWGERGVEGKMETAVILRVREAAILDTLRNNPKTRDFIGESLGDLSAIIRPDQWQKLRNAATELGLLLDINV